MTREKAKKHIEINLIALYDIGENIIECDDVMVIIDEIYNDHEAELEALQQRSCEGCVREAEDMVDPHCAFCSRACEDNYEPKEQ